MKNTEDLHDAVQESVSDHKRIIQQRLQNALATELLKGEFQEGQTIRIDAIDGEFVFE